VEKIKKETVHQQAAGKAEVLRKEAQQWLQNE